MPVGAGATILAGIGRTRSCGAIGSNRADLARVGAIAAHAEEQAALAALAAVATDRPGGARAAVAAVADPAGIAAEAAVATARPGVARAAVAAIAVDDASVAAGRAGGGGRHAVGEELLPGGRADAAGLRRGRRDDRDRLAKVAEGDGDRAHTGHVSRELGRIARLVDPDFDWDRVVAVRRNGVLD